MKIENELGDISIVFDTGHRFWELLRATGNEIPSRSYTFKQNKGLPWAKFSIGREGNYRLYKSVEREEKLLCGEAECSSKHRHAQRRIDLREYNQPAEYEPVNVYHHNIHHEYGYIEHTLKIKL